MKFQIPFNQFGFTHLNIESGINSPLLLNELEDRGLAIVGSRNPQLRSFSLIEKTIRDLRRSNRVIISGFARGVDSKAHELALDHGLKTIAILGCGLKVDYPRENRQLRKKIIEAGGMLISPFEDHAPALPHHFLQRNQLIAFFAKAVWVVEAAAISGSLNTAAHASNLNRDLYATPGFPGDPLYRGNELLLSQINPERFPVAEAFFGAHSLLKSWSDLEINIDSKSLFLKSTLLQKWVDDLKISEGMCRIQSLMNYAVKQGMSPGDFYRDYEKHIKTGLLTEGPLGSIEIPTVPSDPPTG